VFYHVNLFLRLLVDHVRDKTSTIVSFDLRRALIPVRGGASRCGVIKVLPSRPERR
jgi:hypothetical protein